MYSTVLLLLQRRSLLAALVCAAVVGPLRAAAPSSLQVGIGVRDITPEQPVWLAGYAARNRPFDAIDTRLYAQAIAFRNGAADPVVFVSVDNCEVSGEFTAPVLRTLGQKHGLGPGRVIIVSSHTHSAPVLSGPLMAMYHFAEGDRDRVAAYGRFLQSKLVEVVDAALEDFKPASLEHAVGRATFAMNRRVYQDDKVVFGENPDGPVAWDVPVLKILTPKGDLRAVLFGYACHGTSIAGDDFYILSGDYMAYARQHLQALYPGTVAVYLTGMGADSNPSPRGTLLDAKRHGLELAGAVAGVLNRPMRPVGGDVKFIYNTVDLPLAPVPDREHLQTDAHSTDVYVRQRAEAYLARMERGEKLPETVPLPVSIVRVGPDLTFVNLGGEVVVDYAIRLKRLLQQDNPWLIGYAYEVPCYIPSVRILKEGGYEAESSLLYYGLYGPLRTRTEEVLVKRVVEMAQAVRN